MDLLKYFTREVNNLLMIYLLETKLKSFQIKHLFLDISK